MAESAAQRAARERNLRRGNPRSYSRTSVGEQGGQGPAEVQDAGKHAAKPSAPSTPDTVAAEGTPEGPPRTIRARPRAAKGGKTSRPRKRPTAAEGDKTPAVVAAEGDPSRAAEGAAEGGRRRRGFFAGLRDGLAG